MAQARTEGGGRGEIDFPLFIFANVGDDSENPATIAYVEGIAKPYAAEHGISAEQAEGVWLLMLEIWVEDAEREHGKA